MHALITATPFEHHNENLVLVTIEDIETIAELTRVVPICASCGSVRERSGEWAQLEEYFGHEWGLEFSHSLCPDCLGSQMKTLQDDSASGTE